jgi:predicted RNA-binding protein with PIN domain
MATGREDRSDPGSGSVSDAFVRPALEHVIEHIRRQRLIDPSMRYPSQLRRFLRPGRLGAADLRVVRRLVEAHTAFREAVAAELPDDADPIVATWLRRPVGWEAELARREAEVERRRADEGAAKGVVAERRRREAAEQRAERAEADLERMGADLASVRAERDALAAAFAGAEATIATLRSERDAARVLARNESDRLAAARERLRRAETEAEGAREVARDAATVRDEVIADRARAVAELGDLLEAADAARRLAERLAELVPDRESAPDARSPLQVPGRLTGDPVGLARHLVRSGATVLIDGYNVSKTWLGDADLESQRRRLVDACEALAARHGADISIVFDGAGIAGAHAGRRRLVRVTWSDPGVTADDVIRAEVDRLPTTRPVVVVTDDNAVRRDAQAAGANLIRSGDFVALLEA